LTFICQIKFALSDVTDIGANTESLARSGFGKLTVVDRDRIEERNLSTLPYDRSDVSAFKAKILANNL